jgi:nuclear GTP-binding protein
LQTLHDKHKIEKKVKEHLRKQRKDMKRNPLKYHRKDPGIPNSWPFKQQLLQQQEQQQQQQEQQQ